jgi:hypothetical protein
MPSEQGPDLRASAHDHLRLDDRHGLPPRGHHRDTKTQTVGPNRESRADKVRYVSKGCPERRSAIASSTSSLRLRGLPRVIEIGSSLGAIMHPAYGEAFEITNDQVLKKRQK